MLFNIIENGLAQRLKIQYRDQSLYWSDIDLVLILILVWYWFWYRSDIDLVLIWYWSDIDLVLIWYWSDIDLDIASFFLYWANRGETEMKLRWNWPAVSLWLSFKPSHHVIHLQLQSHDVLGDDRFTQSHSPGAMWAAVSQGGNVSHERFLLVCPAPEYALLKRFN